MFLLVCGSTSLGLAQTDGEQSGIQATDESGHQLSPPVRQSIGNSVVLNVIYEAPSGCPTADVLRTLLAEQFGTEIVSGPGPTLRVVIAQNESLFRVDAVEEPSTEEVGTPNGQFRRSFEDPDCSVVVRTLALSYASTLNLIPPEEVDTATPQGQHNVAFDLDSGNLTHSSRFHLIHHTGTTPLTGCEVRCQRNLSPGAYQLQLEGESAISHPFVISRDSLVEARFVSEGDTRTWGTVLLVTGIVVAAAGPFSLPFLGLAGAPMETLVALPIVWIVIGLAGTLVGWAMTGFRDHVDVRQTRRRTR